MKIDRWMAALALLAVGACGGGGGGSPAGASANGNPTLTATANDTDPLMGGTSVVFTATGSDPNGDALSYSWNFGDGTTGSGQSTTHVFGTAGAFTVIATVSDGKGGTATANVIVTSRSLSGTWTSQARAWNFQLQHQGSQITGSLLGFKGFVYNPPFPLTGVVRDSHRVEFDVPGGLSFVGTANAGATQMTGTLSEGSRDYGEILDKR